MSAAEENKDIIKTLVDKFYKENTELKFYIKNILIRKPMFYFSPFHSVSVCCNMSDDNL